MAASYSKWALVSNRKSLEKSLDRINRIRKEKGRRKEEGESLVFFAFAILAII
ncbi:MAG: hypothetical protein PHS17_01885 [Desulfobacterales bacterium]|nr:hypothetical protein [Desulfobacterales bacterium]